MLWYYLLLPPFAFVHSKIVTPPHYLYPTGEIVSVNGSDINGRCTFASATFGGSLTTCTAPTTSVLFDGNVPTLTGLDGDMWASQLLTLQTTNPIAQLLFDFTTPDYSRVEEVEVVMFNCPQWRISADSISVSVGPTLSGIGAPVVTVNPTITSCDYLVRVCISVSTTQPVLRLEFSRPVDSDWVYLAEVKFNGNTGMCAEAIITPTTTSLATTATLSDTEVTGTTTEHTDANADSTTMIAGLLSASILSVLLVVVVCVLLVSIAVWKYHSRSGGADETVASAGGEGHEYEEVDIDKGGAGEGGSGPIADMEAGIKQEASSADEDQEYELMNARGDQKTFPLKAYGIF